MIEHEELHCELRCERCGEWLKRGRQVWLELNCSTGEWVKAGTAPWSDGPKSQGCFPFGSACARRVLQTQSTEVA